MLIHVVEYQDGFEGGGPVKSESDRSYLEEKEDFEMKK